MRKKLTWVMWISIAIGIMALYTGRLLATPASGFVGTTLAMGRFGEIDVFNFNQVLPQNGNVWLSLQKAKVPVELHLYPSGGHGYGLRRTEKPVTTWPQRAEDWLRSQGMLGARAQPAR